MLLIAFANNNRTASNSHAENSGTKATKAPTASPLGSAADNNLLNTGFKATEETSKLVSKTVLAVVAKVYLMASCPLLGEFWAKLADDGALAPVSKPDSLLREITQAIDILVSEPTTGATSLELGKEIIGDFLKDILEDLQTNQAAQEEDPLFFFGLGSPAQSLLSTIIDEQLKDLVVGAVVQQKQIWENYLAGEKDSDLEIKNQRIKQELEDSLRSLNQPAIRVRSTGMARETTILIEEEDPLSTINWHRTSFAARESLAVTVGRNRQTTPASTDSLLEEKTGQVKERQQLDQLRAYWAALEPNQRLGLASALHRQATQGQKANLPLLEVVTELLKADHNAVALAN